MAETGMTYRRLSISTHRVGECLVWLVIVAPAYIDWLNGLLAIEYGIQLLSSIYRICLIFVGMLLMCAQPRVSIVIIGCMYMLFALIEFVSWSIYSQVFIVEELLSFSIVFLFFFSYVIISYATRYLKVSHDYVLQKIVSYGIVTGLIIIVSLFMDIGIPTYSTSAGEIYGFGTQSYYIAGNVLGLSLVVSLVVAIYRFITNFCLRYFLESLIIFVGAFCVGSRTGMLVSTLMMAFAVPYFIFLSSGRFRHKVALAIVFLPMFVFGGFKAYELVSQYETMLEKLDSLLVADIRDQYAAPAWDYLMLRDMPNQLAGDSLSKYSREYAQYGPRKKAEATTTEQDFVDVMGAYGAVGLLVLFFPYLLGILMAGANMLISRRSVYTVSFICLLLFLGHSLAAGHVLFSPKAVQFASVFFVLALSRFGAHEMWFWNCPRRIRT